MSTPPTSPVTFLLFDAFGRGGVARTVLNLADQLVEHRPVRVISLFRGRGRTGYPVDPRIPVEVLLDDRADLGPVRRRSHDRPTALRPVPVEQRLSRLTDRLLRRRLRALEPGVLVTTRPSLHLAGARWAARGVRVVGQDHKNFPARFRQPAMARVLHEAVPRLDAYVVLTEADAEDYRRELPSCRGRVAVIRNALPWPVTETPAALGSRTVVAAGRLTRDKGFDRLLDAFAPVARAHPDWQLRVYGEGPLRAALEARAQRLGIDGQVALPGHADDLRRVLADASAYAMTSHSEGFPMVLIEALSLGVPPVAMDCPRGPGEIVAHEGNGLLVPDGDVAGFSAALLRLVEDGGLRVRCGRRAREDARQYTREAVVPRWLDLLARVDAGSTPAPLSPSTSASPLVHPALPASSHDHTGCLPAAAGRPARRAPEERDDLPAGHARHQP